jgi:hypothetical protein
LLVVKMTGEVSIFENGNEVENDEEYWKWLNTIFSNCLFLFRNGESTFCRNDIAFLH